MLPTGLCSGVNASAAGSGVPVGAVGAVTTRWWAFSSSSMSASTVGRVVSISVRRLRCASVNEPAASTAARMEPLSLSSSFFSSRLTSTAEAPPVIGQIGEPSLWKPIGVTPRAPTPTVRMAGKVIGTCPSKSSNGMRRNSLLLIGSPSARGAGDTKRAQPAPSRMRDSRLRATYGSELVGSLAGAGLKGVPAPVRACVIELR